MLRRIFLKTLLLSPLLLKTKLFAKKENEMSYTIHRSHERGSAEHGWLHSKFSFSFAEYRNYDRMGFGALRVINDDIVEPGKGFDMHPHQDMEIISVVTKGSLEHKDSAGNHGVIKAGEIQYMSTGNGVYHSEFNPSEDERIEFFQVWIIPDSKGGKPLYDQRDFSSHDHQNQWVTLVSNDEKDNAMPIKQNAKIYTTDLDEGNATEMDLCYDGHGRLVFVVNGSVEINGETLSQRDEMQITDNKTYAMKALKDSKVIVFEVPMI